MKFKIQDPRCHYSRFKIPRREVFDFLRGKQDSRLLINKQSSIFNLQFSIRNGFTLIEILIALAISSVIFLAIISTYSLTMKIVEKWDKREEDYYLARNIFRRMHSEISSLYFVSSGEEKDELRGDEKTLQFYTVKKSVYLPFTGLIKITYEFTVDDEGKTLLVRKEEPLVNFSLEENVIEKSYVWSETLKDFSFEYSDGRNWYDSIDETQKLKAIKIILVSSHEEKFSTIIYLPMTYE